MSALIFVLLAMVLPQTSIAETRRLGEPSIRYSCLEFVTDPSPHFPIGWEVEIKDGQVYLNLAGDNSNPLLMSYLGRGNEHNPPYFQGEVTDAYYVPYYGNDGISLNLSIKAPFKGFLRSHGFAGPSEWLCNITEN
jgi:hypothetical protein